MLYYIASDHAGVDLKQFIKELLEDKNIVVEDLGPTIKERVDYCDYASKVAKVVQNNSSSKGILICSTGIGMSIAANKYISIRAALTHNTYTASMARKHNDANILCLGAKIISKDVAKDIINAWLSSEFEAGRHTSRVEKVNAIRG